jgi:hypothetical protein
MTLRFERLKRDAPTVAATIRRTVQQKGCPVHLFVCPHGSVYVVPETHPAAATWPMAKFAWFVGTYAYVHRGHESMLRPDDDGILEDLAEHMADVIPAEHRLTKLA